jgi:hypothetical protein
MKKIYSIPLLLTLTACTLPSNSEVIMRASPEKRTSKEYMPSPEKPLKDPVIEKQPAVLPPIAPQIGIRVPFEQ